MIEVYDAKLARNKVQIPKASRLMELRERGFGDLRGGNLVLTIYESFYLHEKGRIRIIDVATKSELSLKDLVERFALKKPEIWIKYLVYRDLRDRGYIVREDSQVVFEVQGKGALRRLISIIYEGGEASLNKLGRLLKHATLEKKELILAVVDRRTDIVYYSLNTLPI